MRIRDYNSIVIKGKMLLKLLSLLFYSSFPARVYPTKFKCNFFQLSPNGMEVNLSLFSSWIFCNLHMKLQTLRVFFFLDNSGKMKNKMIAHEIKRKKKRVKDTWCT